MNDLSEKEQIEAIRDWWRDNGNYVIAGIVVGIVTIFGWKQYQASVLDEQVEASILFEEVMGATGRGNMDAAVSAADELFAEHDGTGYAAQARLALARLYMDNGRDVDAANALRAVIENNSGEALEMVARLRLAKVLLYQDKAQDVVDLLDGQPDSAFSARFSEALGDAYFALGEYAQAEAAYLEALNDDPAAPTVDRNLVQLKINDLPSLNEVSAEPEASGAAEAPAETAAEADAAPMDEAPAEADDAAEPAADTTPDQAEPETDETEGGEGN